MKKDLFFKPLQLNDIIIKKDNIKLVIGLIGVSVVFSIDSQISNYHK